MIPCVFVIDFVAMISVDVFVLGVLLCQPSKFYPACVCCPCAKDAACQTHTCLLTEAHSRHKALRRMAKDGTWEEEEKDTEYIMHL